ncbi:MAG: VapE domain-containing protein [Clostridium sp.]
MKISIGKSRMEKVWENMDVTWEQLVKKLRNTKRTFETVEEFEKFEKEKRDNIKDVGGFVGGFLKDGVRRKGNVLSRSLITLDVDYGCEKFFEKVTLLKDFKCLLYSTHSHRKGHERYRLVIPLKREITSKEYEKVSRLIAEDLGMEQFDKTTFEPERLMYWPSTSKDGEYVFKIQEGEELDPEEYLKRSNPEKDIRKEMKRKKNPLERKDIIGAFCRVYSIEDAIEKFLSDVYEKTEFEGRYKYIDSKSGAGMVVYDGIYSFSHHSKDLACGILCNSFELVRIHKFPNLDKDKSLDKMKKFCMKDEKVRDNVIEGKFKGNEYEPWMKTLDIDSKGRIRPTSKNIITILRMDKSLKGIAYNEHKNALYIREETPWRRLKEGFTDTDMANIKSYIEIKYDIWAPMKVKEGVNIIGVERAYHPVQEYLESLKPWDGIGRVDRLLIDYLGAEDTAYTRGIIRKTLVAAVKRIYEKGAKFDSILILNGPQGIGKSTFFNKLGKEWFSDSLTLGDMKDKTAAEKLQGYWILELGELAGIKKADIEVVKSFVTRTDDIFRASYGTTVESHLRQAVIVGTTNNEEGFLRDITGNRRFWPVKVKKGKKKPWELKEIDEIWAEALHLYKKGESLTLGKEERKIAEEKQLEAMESDEREGLVREYLEKLLPEEWDKMDIHQRRNYLNGTELGEKRIGIRKREKVCNMEIWAECFGKDPGNLRKRDSQEIIAILLKIEGWELYDAQMRFSIYNRQRGFKKVEEGKSLLYFYYFVIIKFKNPSP